jgi:hypothetical protein
MWQQQLFSRDEHLWSEAGMKKSLPVLVSALQ